MEEKKVCSIDFDYLSTNSAACITHNPSQPPSDLTGGGVTL